MTHEECTELKGTLSLKKANIDYIRGAYVSRSGEVEDIFDLDLETLGEEMGKKMLSLLKKPIGEDGKDYTTINIGRKKTKQLKRLMALRDDELKDRDSFLDLIAAIAASDFGNDDKDYFVFAAYNAVDLKKKKEDDLEDQSEEMFRFITCAVCPTKHAGSQYNYFKAEGVFKAVDLGWPVSAPCLGFVYPTFDGRATNLDAALLYSKSLNTHPSVIETLFGVDYTDYVIPESDEDDAEGEGAAMSSLASALSSLQAISGAVDAIAKRAASDEELEDGEDPNEPEADDYAEPDTHTDADATSELGANAEEADVASEPMEISATEPKPESNKAQKPRVSIHAPDDARLAITQQVVNGKLCFVISVEDVADINGVAIDA